MTKRTAAIRPPQKSAEMAPDAPRPTIGSGKVRLRDFSKSLPMALLRTRESIMQHFRPALRHYGITEQQWRILRALASIDSIEIMALAEAIYLLPPSLSRILKTLDERGLIVRKTSDKDMRRGLVSISPKGLALIDEAGHHAEQIYGEITRRFGSERMMALHAMLRELEDAVAEELPVTTQLIAETKPVPTLGGKRGRPRKHASSPK